METAYPLEPSKTLNLAPFGSERAMTELLILIAFHHGASRLEYRTFDGEFRVAEIIDDRAFEFPPPPNCIRAPTIEYLQEIFSVRPGTTQTRELRVGTSLAIARCEIFEDNQNAIIHLVLPFTPKTNLRYTIQRFWRTRALKQGSIALLKHYLSQAVWRLGDIAHQASHRSHGGVTS